jgi:hypothetical protein
MGANNASKVVLQILFPQYKICVESEVPMCLQILDSFWIKNNSVRTAIEHPGSKKTMRKSNEEKLASVLRKVMTAADVLPSEACFFNFDSIFESGVPSSDNFFFFECLKVLKEKNLVDLRILTCNCSYCKSHVNFESLFVIFIFLI